MTTDIELALAKGKVEGARKLLQEYYEAQDKQEFEAKLRAEYDELFPSTRDETYEEYVNWYTTEFGDNQYLLESEYVCSKVNINYSQDENYVTFEEYKNETRVVQKAELNTDTDYDSSVYGIDWSDLDEDVRLQFLSQNSVPEVTELVRPYIAKDVTDRVNEYLKSKYAELRAKAYPPMEMFADAWVKNDTEAMEEYRRLCLEVKDRFPK